jgi:nitrogen fixation/metabolism regulation signal transduction histidine kinase
MLKKDQIKLVLNLDENLPETKCRSQQIQQVIMNLLTNARDALNDKYPSFDDNKQIVLSCKCVEHDNRRWIRLGVKDFGNGISKENREKIFFENVLSSDEECENASLALVEAVLLNGYTITDKRLYKTIMKKVTELVE